MEGLHQEDKRVRGRSGKNGCGVCLPSVQSVFQCLFENLRSARRSSWRRKNGAHSRRFEEIGYASQWALMKLMNQAEQVNRLDQRREGSVDGSRKLRRVGGRGRGPEEGCLDHVLLKQTSARV